VTYNDILFTDHLYISVEMKLFLFITSSNLDQFS